MKFFLTALFICLNLSLLSAQTFTITDLSTNWKDSSDTQKMKMKNLGATMKLSFYDSTVIFEKFVDRNGVEFSNMKMPVLNKTDKSTYSVTDKDGKSELKIVTYFGKITSATLTSYDYRKGHEREYIIFKLTRK